MKTALMLIALTSFLLTGCGEVTTDWDYLANSLIVTPPYWKDGRLFFADQDAVIALDANTGKAIWKIDLQNSTIFPSEVTTNTVYFAEGKHLYAINAVSGLPIWKYDAVDYIHHYGAYSPVGNTIFIDADNRNTYAIDIRSGAEQWHHGGENPVVFGDSVYLDTGILYAIDSSIGHDKWVFPAPDYFETVPYGLTSPLVVNGIAYVGDAFERLYALDVQTGKLLWRTKVQGGFSSRALYLDGALLVATYENGLNSINPQTGQQNWHFQVQRDVWTSIYGPVLADGIAYIGGEDGRFYAVDAKTGVEKWRYNPPKQLRDYFNISGTLYYRISYAPAIGNGRVYFSSANHYMHAIRLR